MISKQTKSAVIVDSRTGLSKIVRARIIRRVTTDDRYQVFGVYEYKNTRPAEDIDPETGEITETEEEYYVQFSNFTKEFTNEEVSGLYNMFKDELTTNAFPEMYDELTSLALVSILVQEGSWGLTANDWE